MPDDPRSKRGAALVACLGIATVAGIAGLQIVDDAPSRSSLERTTNTTTTTTKG